MVNLDTNSLQTLQAAQPAANNQRVAQPQPQKIKPQANDSVQVSSAAQALLESTETAAQTAKEAGAGDKQAQTLLAKESAQHQCE